MSTTETITYSKLALVERELLSPVEAAHVLGMGRTKVYELIQTGAIQSMKIGKSRRIPRREIDRYIESLIS
jgi:excisionase family DNA binding protein